MSLLPPHAIDEFQALWKEHYGTELSREEASVHAHRVFTLIRLLVEPPMLVESPAHLEPPANASNTGVARLTRHEPLSGKSGQLASPFKFPSNTDP